MEGRDELIVVLHDTSDIRRLETVKRDFVVNASHELRTPLTSIRGSLEMLEGQLSGDSERWVDTIRRNAERMSAIVEDLLLLSSLEARGAEPPASRLTWKRSWTMSRACSQAAPRQKGSALKVSVAAPLPALAADSFLLEQMLVNLLDNALKYTEAGEVALSVDGEERGWVRIGFPTRESGFPRSTFPGCSSGSTSWTSRAPESSAGPGWGFPSSSTSCRATGER